MFCCQVIFNLLFQPLFTIIIAFPNNILVEVLVLLRAGAPQGAIIQRRVGDSTCGAGFQACVTIQLKQPCVVFTQS